MIHSNGIQDLKDVHNNFLSRLIGLLKASNKMPALISKKYRYQSIKQKEKSKVKNPKDKISHETRRHMTGQHEPL